MESSNEFGAAPDGYGGKKGEKFISKELSDYKNKKFKLAKLQSYGGPHGGSLI